MYIPWVMCLFAWLVYTPELKQLGICPTFQGALMKWVCLDSIQRMLLDVVQRSQLQTSHNRDRDIIIIPTILSLSRKSDLHFDTGFQFYYSFVLQEIILAYANDLALMKIIFCHRAINVHFSGITAKHKFRFPLFSDDMLWEFLIPLMQSRWRMTS